MNQPNLEQDLENDLVDDQPNPEQDSDVPVSNTRSQYGNYPVADFGDTFFGNKDHERKHKLPKDWAKKVCVYQCQIQALGGGIVEVPNTHQLQTYEPATYDKLSADAKGQPSFFSESKMKVVVLHDPRA